jgi:hypothetical protein
VLDKTVGVAGEVGTSDEGISAMVEVGAISVETKDVSIEAALSDEATVTKELKIASGASDDTAEEMVEIPEGVPGKVLIISEENSLDRVIGALEVAASVMMVEEVLGMLVTEAEDASEKLLNDSEATAVLKGTEEASEMVL